MVDQSPGGMLVEGKGAKVDLSDRSVDRVSMLIEHETDCFFAFWADHPVDVGIGLAFLLVAGVLWRKTALDKVRLKHELKEGRHGAAPMIGQTPQLLHRNAPNPRLPPRGANK